MRTGLLIFAAATCLQVTAMGQTSPTLQITNHTGSVSFSWSGVSNYYSLQGTTNLSRPVTWTDQQIMVYTPGTGTIATAYPQQFFRLAPETAIFQFSIFYNVNLEIDPGNATMITAPVFCNQNIWEGSSACTFASTVTAVGTNAPQIANPFALNYNGSGPSTFAGGQPVSHAPPLALAGLGTNTSPATMRSILELPPAAYSLGTAPAYSSNGLAYLANSCDLVITNHASGTNTGAALPNGTNLVVYFQDDSLTPLSFDYYFITNGNRHITFATNYISPTLLGPNTNIYFAGFTWVTNISFYDWREGWNGGNGPPKRVEAVQIDMAKLNTWLTNNTGVNSGYNSDQAKIFHSGSHIGSVFIYTSVPLTTSQLPAVRVVNGAQLPNPGGSTRGFTVATPFPIYVLGDYNSQNNGLPALGTTNTANTLPAALMGDSITILSDSWNDGVSNKMPLTSSTTVNAAMLVGIVRSDPSISGDYSGGMENFMRLLENWSGNVLTYNGSIVVPFYSQYATNHWRPTGNYYNVPTRHYGFDSNFANWSKLPPLTLSVENYLSP